MVFEKIKFPIEKVLLCEGITEEILMPKFAKIDGYDFDKNGVHLISAGGKNQVAKLYCELKDELKIPVFILLDADAKETSENIKSVLRQKDRIYLIKHGEFEDILSINLLKRSLNGEYMQTLPAVKSDFHIYNSMCENIEYYYKSRRDLSSEIKDIIEAVKKL